MGSGVSSRGREERAASALWQALRVTRCSQVVNCSPPRKPFRCRYTLIHTSCTTSSAAPGPTIPAATR